MSAQLQLFEVSVRRLCPVVQMPGTRKAVLASTNEYVNEP